jgi:transforming growth factor-beta-induced protein
MMKTKLRNLGMALVLAVAVIGVNASEMKNIADIALEPKLEVENWMTDYTLFDVNKSVSSAGSVVDIAVSNPDFSILVEAVTKAGLAGALSADGPFTVFAPTNDAFNTLFEELGVDGIEDLSKEQLTPILTYHVVSGKVMSSDLSNTSVATLNGKKIDVKLSEGVHINDSKVLTADIAGNNGVIHVIDKVLIPEAESKSSGCGH